MGDLMQELGYAEVQMEDSTSHRWPHWDLERFNARPHELELALSRVTRAREQGNCEELAVLLERQLKALEELRRQHDWSFESSLFRPCVPVIEALRQQYE